MVDARGGEDGSITERLREGDEDKEIKGTDGEMEDRAGGEKSSKKNKKRNYTSRTEEIHLYDVRTRKKRRGKICTFLIYKRCDRRRKKRESG